MRPYFEDPAALLRQADAVMRAMQPAFTTSFCRDGVTYRARFAYPGVLLVFDRACGLLVAKSRTGRPRELAKSRSRKP